MQTPHLKKKKKKVIIQSQIVLEIDNVPCLLDYGYIRIYDQWKF